MQISINLKVTNCCEATPIEKLIYFHTDACKMRKIRTFENSVFVIVGN